MECCRKTGCSCAVSYTHLDVYKRQIHNVIDFLERMETTTEVRNVDFLELRACDRSCAGGVLAVANRFLTAERIMKRSMKRDKAPLIYASERLGALAYLKQHITIRPLQPNPKWLYDGSIEEVLKKMEQVRRLMCYLPGIDWGACGNPCLLYTSERLKNLDKE